MFPLLVLLLIGGVVFTFWLGSRARRRLGATDLSQFGAFSESGVIPTDLPQPSPAEAGHYVDPVNASSPQDHSDGHDPCPDNLSSVDCSASSSDFSSGGSDGSSSSD